MFVGISLYQDRCSKTLNDVYKAIFRCVCLVDGMSRHREAGEENRANERNVALTSTVFGAFLRPDRLRESKRHRHCSFVAAPSSSTSWCRPKRVCVLRMASHPMHRSFRFDSLHYSHHYYCYYYFKQKPECILNKDDNLFFCLLLFLFSPLFLSFRFFVSLNISFYLYILYTLKYNQHLLVVSTDLSRQVSSFDHKYFQAKFEEVGKINKSGTKERENNKTARTYITNFIEDFFFQFSF